MMRPPWCDGRQTPSDYLAPLAELTYRHRRLPCCLFHTISLATTSNWPPCVLSLPLPASPELSNFPTAMRRNEPCAQAISAIDSYILRKVFG